MKIAFYGGQTAGMIVLLTLLNLKHEIKYVIADDEKISTLTKQLKIKSTFKDKLNTDEFIEELSKNIDLFICCHGWKILSKEFVTKIKCINFHPCLYKYKGLHPIRRLIDENNARASVAVHWMTEKIDAGETIKEEFQIINDISQKSESEVYNELYPLYIKTLFKAIKLVSPLK